jgi:hypothetical protein
MKIESLYFSAVQAGKVSTQTNKYPAHDICEGKLDVSAWDKSQNPKKVKHLGSSHLC